MYHIYMHIYVFVCIYGRKERQWGKTKLGGTLISSCLVSWTLNFEVETTTVGRTVLVVFVLYICVGGSGCVCVCLCVFVVSAPKISGKIGANDNKSKSSVHWISSDWGADDLSMLFMSTVVDTLVIDSVYAGWQVLDLRWNKQGQMCRLISNTFQKKWSRKLCPYAEGFLLIKFSFNVQMNDLTNIKRSSTFIESVPAYIYIRIKYTYISSSGVSLASNQSCFRDRSACECKYISKYC